MVTLNPTASDLRAYEEAPKATTRKPPKKGGPVLMADCITPLGGETLLSLLWKRWETDDVE